MIDCLFYNLFYFNRRAELGHSNVLTIDYLMGKCGAKLRELWLREGGDGTYPPPTVRALILTYLLESIPADLKHCIVMYFCFDISRYYSEKEYVLILL